MASRGRRAARAAEMRAVLEKWERSGLRLSRFAEREGIARKTMYRWRRRLGVSADEIRRGRRPGACGGAARATAQSASMFTEVSAVWRPAAAVTIEVVLRSGTIVRVPEHFDAGSLRGLLQTLGAC